MKIEISHLTAIALCVGAVVRLLKAGRLNEWVPARWRPVAALWLGGVAAVVEHLAAGQAWPAAVLTAALGVAGAVLGHDVLIEAVRGGRELGAPKAGAALLLLGLPFVGCGGVPLRDVLRAHDAAAEAVKQGAEVHQSAARCAEALDGPQPATGEVLECVLEATREAQEAVEASQKAAAAAEALIEAVEGD